MFLTRWLKKLFVIQTYETQFQFKRKCVFLFSFIKNVLGTKEPRLHSMQLFKIYQHEKQHQR